MRTRVFVKPRAFTLVELVVGIIIVIVLAGVSYLAWNLYVHRAGVAACEAGTKQIADMITAHAAVNSESVQAVVATPDGVVGQGTSDYASLRYGLAIPPDAQRVSLVENADHTRMELTVEFRDFTAQGLYYTLGQPGSVTHGTLVCEPGGSGSGGGGSDPPLGATYPDPRIPTPGPGSGGGGEGTSKVCPVVTGANGQTLSFSITDQAKIDQLAGEGITLNSLDGCFTKTGEFTSYNYTDVAGYLYSPPFVSSAPDVRCGIADGAVRCWGAGTPVADPPTLKAGLPGVDATQIENIWNGLCTLLADGQVWCWGYDITFSQAKAAGANVTDAKAIFGACMIKTDDTVWCGAPASGTDIWTYQQMPDYGPGTYTGTVKALTPDGGCTVTTSGDVYCTGADSSHRLGQGNTYTLPTPSEPVKVELSGPATSVALSGETYCALLVNSTVQCWGGNNAGQVGLGVKTSSYPWPRTVLTDATTTLSGVTSLSGAAGAFCATITDGKVTCWGSLSGGTGGDGNEAATNAPYASTIAWADGTGGQLSDIKLIQPIQTSEGVEPCAVKTTGEVYCWGMKNTYGQLGDGTTVGKAYPVQVQRSGQVAFSDLVVNITDGTRTATTPTFTLSSGTPTPPATLGTPQTITVGNRLIDNYKSVASVNTQMSSPGKITYTTNKTSEQLAAADYQFNPANGQITPAYQYDRYNQVVVTDHNHNLDAAANEGKVISTCGLTQGGIVKCWGYAQTAAPISQYGYALEDTPKWIPILDKTVTKLVGNTASPCALTTDGQVACWGVIDTATASSNTRETASYGHGEFGPVYVPLASGGNLSNVIALGPVGGSGCAVVGDTLSSTSGKVYCWGNNDLGQLGRGTTNYNTDHYQAGTASFKAAEATRVTQVIGDVVDVSGSCAIDDNAGRSMYCWGLDSETDTLAQNDVVHVSLPGPAEAIYGDCALVAGSIYCATTDVDSQTGTTYYIGSATQMAYGGTPLTGVTSFMRSGDNICAIAGAAATVYCAGTNAYGVTGNGNETNLNVSSPGFTPVRTDFEGTQELTGASSVAVYAGRNGCATRTDGTVWCWGTTNDSYQLGTGDTEGYAYAVPAKQTGPYPTLPGVTVTATGVSAATSPEFTIQDSGGSSSLLPSSRPTSPGQLRAIPGNTQVALDWAATPSTPELQVTGYRVYKWSQTLGSYVFLAQTEDLSYTDTALVNGTSYRYAVAAFGPDGQGKRGPYAEAVPFTVTAAPSSLAAVIGDNQLTLSWTVTNNYGSAPTDYVIEKSLTGEEAWIAFDDGVSAAKSAAVTGLANGTTYDFRVASINAAGQSPWSTSFTATPASVPQAPADFTATPGVNRVDLSWTAVAGTPAAPVTGYRLYKSTDGGISWTFLTQTVSTSYPHTGLVGGATWTYKVTATGSGGEGLSSGAQTAVVPSTVPNAPGGLGATLGDGQLSLSWNAPVANGEPVTDYVIWWKTLGGTWGVLDDGAGTQTSLLVSPLTNGISYQFQIAAVNLDGQGPWSNTLTATPAAIPGQPANLVAVASPGAVALTWDAVPSPADAPVSTYRIYRSLSADSGYTFAQQGAGTSWTDSGRTNGTTYYYKVTAYGPGGEGIASSYAAATPLTTPGLVQSLNAAPVGSGLLVSWTAPASNGGSAITEYKLQYRVTGSQDWLPTTAMTVVGTSQQVNSLTPLTNYDIQVAAVTNYGQGTYANTSTSIVTAGQPAAPATVTTAPYGSAADVSWTVPPSDGGAPLTSYTAYAYSALTGGTLRGQCTVAAPATSCRITGLTNGQASYVEVKSDNGMAASAASTPRKAVTPAVAAASGPLNVTVAGTPNVNGSLSISWGLPADNGGAAIGYYFLQYSMDGSTGWANIPAGAGTCNGNVAGTSCTFSGRPANTTFYIRVMAHNSAGWGASSTPAAGATNSVPGAPTAITVAATPNTNGSLNISWSPPLSNGGANVLYYGIQYSMDGSTGWANIPAGAGTCNGNVAGTSCTFSGRPANTTVYIRGLAYNAVGWGGASPVGSGATNTAPGAPTDVSVAAPPSVSGSLDIVWSPPASNGGANIDYYFLQYSLDGATAWTQIPAGYGNCSGNINLTACSFSGRGAGKTLYIRVMAHNVVNWGAASIPAFGTTN